MDKQDVEKFRKYALNIAILCCVLSIIFIIATVTVSGQRIHLLKLTLPVIVLVLIVYFIRSSGKK